MRIDAHAIIGQENHLQLDVDTLLRRMDAAEIDLALVRPCGSALVVDNEVGNRELLSAGPRLRAMVSVNPWYGAAALNELRRCRDEGAVGLFLHPARQGFMPTESIVARMLELVASWGWPIMMHTGTYINADILALAVVASRFPDTPFIAGWGGFTDMWFELPGVMARTPNLYLDSSLIWGEAVVQIANECGPDRVVFGGGEPRNRYAVALRMLERLELEPSKLALIMAGNAARLWRLETAP